MVMKHMSLDGTVHDETTDETEVAVDGGLGAAKESMRLVVVIWESWGRMLKERYCH